MALSSISRLKCGCVVCFRCMHVIKYVKGCEHHSGK